jgi:hypothetical protein
VKERVWNNENVMADVHGVRERESCDIRAREEGGNLELTGWDFGFSRRWKADVLLGYGTIRLHRWIQLFHRNFPPLSSGHFSLTIQTGFRPKTFVTTPDCIITQNDTILFPNLSSQMHSHLPKMPDVVTFEKYCHVLVTRHGVWIHYWIYWTLISRSYE